MIKESQKRQIQELINSTGRQIFIKRKELDELRRTKEDKVSVFLKEGEIPEVFNDPTLNARYNRLNLSEKKLNELQAAYSSAIVTNNVPGDIFINHVRNQIEEINKI